MWTPKDRNYMYRDVFEEFYRYLGTNIPKDDVFNIRVDIKKDPEGYEKLRQKMIEFFNGIDLYHYYTEELGFVGLAEFDAAIDLIENFVRVSNKLGGKSLDIQGSNPGEIFRQLISYEKVYDIRDLGDEYRLKLVAKSKSVFTLRELFDFFHFEYKVFLAPNQNNENTYESVIRAILYVFNYTQEYVQTSDRVFIGNVVKHWEEKTENGTVFYPYDEFKDFINEMSKKGRGANSPLRLIYIVVTNFIKWVSDAPRTSDQKNWTIETFMKILQKYIKPVKNF